MAIWHHAYCRLLGDKEAAKRTYSDGLLDFGYIKGNERSPRPGTGVIYDDIRKANLAFDILEELRYLTRVGSIASESHSPGTAAKGCKLFRVPGGKGNLKSFARKKLSQRGTESAAASDNQGAGIFCGHIARFPIP